MKRAPLRPGSAPFGVLPCYLVSSLILSSYLEITWLFNSKKVTLVLSSSFLGIGYQFFKQKVTFGVFRVTVRIEHSVVIENGRGEDVWGIGFWTWGCSFGVNGLRRGYIIIIEWMFDKWNDWRHCDVSYISTYVFNLIILMFLFGLWLGYAWFDWYTKTPGTWSAYICDR